MCFIFTMNIPGIGIDLGTSTCCVSIWRNGKYEIVPLNNNIILKSVLVVDNNTKSVGYINNKMIIFYTNVSLYFYTT